jgi:hypothetical protein
MLAAKKRSADPGPALVLLFAVTLGLALRLAPGLRDPGIEFQSDAAFHARMVRAVLASGALPARDTRGGAPEGRDIGALVPPGLYHAGAAFHRLLPWGNVTGENGRRALEISLMAFEALAGALVAVPVWFATRALARDARGAACAALAIAVMPSSLDRTFGDSLRPDALGTLLIVTHLAFLLRALRRTGRVTDSLLAAFALAAALVVWRVALVIPALEAIFVLGRVAWRGVEAEVREAFLPTALIATLLCFPLRYLAVMRYALSFPSLLVVAAALATLVPRLGPGRSRPPWRLAMLAGLIALAWVAAVVCAVPSPLAPILRLLAARASWPRSTPDPITMLMLGVEEPFALSPLALFSPQQLSAAGVWFVAAPLVLLWGRGRAGIARAAPAPTLLAFLALAFTAMTLLFPANAVVAAPVVAIVLGWVWASLLRAPAGSPSGAASRRASPKRRARFAIQLAFMACLSATAIAGSMLALSRRSRLEPDFAAALRFVREQLPGDARVASSWELGYDIESTGERATLVDGLFESPLDRRRVLELNAAFMAPGTDSLARLCRRLGADWVLVPPGEKLETIARLTNPKLAVDLRNGDPPEGADLNRALVRLMLPEAAAPFVSVFASGSWRVYQLSGGSASIRSNP